MSTRGAKKYRPYFTLSELQTISAALAGSADAELIRYVESLIYEITKGYRSHSHITNPRASIEERLGVGETQGPTIEEIQAEESKLFGAS